MVRTFRGCSARGKAEQLVFFCSVFCWIFVQIVFFIFGILLEYFWHRIGSMVIYFMLLLRGNDMK